MASVPLVQVVEGQAKQRPNNAILGLSDKCVTSLLLVCPTTVVFLSGANWPQNIAHEIPSIPHNNEETGTEFLQLVPGWLAEIERGNTALAVRVAAGFAKALSSKTTTAIQKSQLLTDLFHPISQVYIDRISEQSKHKDEQFVFDSFFCSAAEEIIRESGEKKTAEAALLDVSKLILCVYLGGTSVKEIFSNRFLPLITKQPPQEHDAIVPVAVSAIIKAFASAAEIHKANNKKDLETWAFVFDEINNKWLQMPSLSLNIKTNIARTILRMAFKQIPLSAVASESDSTIRLVAFVSKSVCRAFPDPETFGLIGDVHISLTQEYSTWLSGESSDGDVAPRAIKLFWEPIIEFYFSLLGRILEKAAGVEGIRERSIDNIRTLIRGFVGEEQAQEGLANEDASAVEAAVDVWMEEARAFVSLVNAVAATLEAVGESSVKLKHDFHWEVLRCLTHEEVSSVTPTVPPSIATGLKSLTSPVDEQQFASHEVIAPESLADDENDENGAVETHESLSMKTARPDDVDPLPSPRLSHASKSPDLAGDGDASETGQDGNTIIDNSLPSIYISGPNELEDGDAPDKSITLYKSPIRLPVGANDLPEKVTSPLPSSSSSEATPLLPGAILPTPHPTGSIAPTVATTSAALNELGGTGQNSADVKESPATSRVSMQKRIPAEILASGFDSTAVPTEEGREGGQVEGEHSNADTPASPLDGDQQRDPDQLENPQDVAATPARKEDGWQGSESSEDDLYVNPSPPVPHGAKSNPIPPLSPSAQLEPEAPANVATPVAPFEQPGLTADPALASAEDSTVLPVAAKANSAPKTSPLLPPSSSSVVEDSATINVEDHSGDIAIPGTVTSNEAQLGSPLLPLGFGITTGFSYMTPQVVVNEGDVEQNTEDLSSMSGAPELPSFRRSPSPTGTSVDLNPFLSPTIHKKRDHDTMVAEAENLSPYGQLQGFIPNRQLGRTPVDGALESSNDNDSSLPSHPTLFSVAPAVRNSQGASSSSVPHPLISAGSDLEMSSDARAPDTSHENADDLGQERELELPELKKARTS
ncbi:hypothetical protein SISSUDRAFT_1123346 [Sistotremastrum suecicum HHB10207 ss-3]|uniref:Uncharacterized protein n=1 Tax=Sistotremastrum suecicum HHB10207 ss-3 TaxID=1314776 RepID=A0A165XV35_9AGAM|nr:hypothetical protein SISSUDRAFT_1123346 [Sistotremastrum suecicum HHB10207 ss-3]